MIKSRTGDAGATSFPRCRARKQQQQGLAVLLLVLFLLTGTLAHLLGTHASVDNAQVINAAKRAQRLNQAKQALMAYAISYADNYQPGGAGPGHLPCPDRSPVDDGVDSNDGPDPPCSRVSTQIGRFPRFTWSRDQGDLNAAGGNSRYGTKRLVFYAHRSLKDEQMWYAVSRSHINNPANLKVNPGTKGLLEVDGSPDIVAVIIDPGPDLSVNQGSRPGDDVRAYLEGSNADGDLEFTQPVDVTASNDLLVSISRAELIEVVTQRVGLFVKRQLVQFRERHCGKSDSACYPPAADSTGSCSVTLQQGSLPLYPGDCGSSLLQAGLLEGIEAGRHWFVRNDWPAFVDYNREPPCEQDQAGSCSIRMVIDSERLRDYIAAGAEPETLPLISISVELKAVTL